MKSIKGLAEGDIVREKGDGNGYGVAANYGSYAAVVRVLHVSNLSEWSRNGQPISAFSNLKVGDVLTHVSKPDESIVVTTIAADHALGTVTKEINEKNVHSWTFIFKANHTKVGK